jgi:molybdopterin-guanine dinucleotide biosynthesis protein A
MKLGAMILAGGRGSRMAADRPKPLVNLAGRPLLAHVLEAVPAEARCVVVNTNDPAPYRRLSHPIVGDLRSDFAGPLAGIEAVSRSPILRETDVTHLLVLPGDTPFLRRADIDPLLQSAGRYPRVARHADRVQPTVALWPLGCLRDLGAFLDAPGRHAIRAYLDQVGWEAVDIDGNDPFFNVNTPDDLAEAEKRLSDG